MTIPESEKRSLYNLLYTMLIERDCEVKRINGIGNHVHMLIDLSPSIALADLVRDLKKETSKALAKDPRFPLWQKWAKEYYACTLSPDDKDSVIAYIRNQEEHHGVEPFDEELDRLCRWQGLTLHNDDFNV